MSFPEHTTPARLFLVCILAGSLPTLWTAPQANAAEDDQRIGMFTTVHGKVEVQHPRATAMIPAIPFEHVLFHDVIETQAQSKTKALFDDDSMLTVGEHSRIEITEHIYNPDQGVRRIVVKLVKGSVRALVSRMFTGGGSKFEVHTPSAVAAARGTYFVVWIDGNQTGVANIGSHGRVDFTSGNTTVALNPFQYSMAGFGSPPAPVAVLAANSPAMVRAAVADTDVTDVAAEESAGQSLKSLRGPGVLVPATVSQSGNGRGKASAPGQTGTSPGLAETTPGQTGATPGNGDGLPPGLAGTSPGQSGMTPGQSGMNPGKGGVSPAPPITISAGAELPPGLVGGGSGKGNNGVGNCGGPCKGGRPK